MEPPELTQYAQDARKHALEIIIPKIVVGGVTGAGKSSILNALVHRHAFEIKAGEPCTRANERRQAREGNAPIVFIDSPGFAEADRQSRNYSENIRRLVAEEAHLYLLVIGAPSRSLDVENTWLQAARRDESFRAVPGIVVVNKIDLMEPTRDWNPSRLNLNLPVSQKEWNIREYMDYIGSLSEFRPFASSHRLLPVSAGESYDDSGQYNIEALRRLMFDLLPDAAKIEFGRQVRLLKLTAHAIVNRYALEIAGAVLLNPIGMGSDAALIVPMQIAMIVEVAKTYGQSMTVAFASSLFGTLMSTFVGRAVFEGIITSIPGLKNIAGPPVAFAVTRTLGHALIELLETNKLNGSREDLQAAARQASGLLKSSAEDYPGDAAAKKSGR